VGLVHTELDVHIAHQRSIITATMAAPACGVVQRTMERAALTPLKESIVMTMGLDVYIADQK